MSDDMSNLEKSSNVMDNLWLPDFKNPEEVEENFQKRLDLFIKLYSLTEVSIESLFPDGFDRQIKKGRIEFDERRQNILWDEIESEREDFRKHFHDFIDYCIAETLIWRPKTDLLKSQSSSENLPFRQIYYPPLSGNMFSMLFFSDAYGVFYQIEIPEEFNINSIEHLNQQIFLISSRYMQTIGNNLQGSKHTNCVADQNHIKEMIRMVILYRICFEDFYSAFTAHHYS